MRQHGSVPRLVPAAGRHNWSAHCADLDAASRQQAHAPGLRVLAWAVNERAQIMRLLDLAVDGLISDRPDLVRAEMARQLHRRGVLTKLRHSAGQDVEGGCGQLRARAVAAEPAAPVHWQARAPSAA